MTDTDAIRVADDLVVVIEEDRLAVRRGSTTAELLPSYARHQKSASAEATSTGSPGRLGLPPRPVLNRLGQMGRLDVAAAGQIGNGPGQLEDTVIGPGAHLQLFHRRPEQAVAGVVHLAELAYLGWSHVGVRQQRSAIKAQVLTLSRRLYSFSNGC
jgi:hypothetical protein